MRQPPHGGLVSCVALSIYGETSQQLDIYVVSEFRFLNVLGHRPAGSGHASEVVLRFGTDH